MGRLFWVEGSQLLREVLSISLVRVVSRVGFKEFGGGEQVVWDEVGEVDRGQEFGFDFELRGSF